MIYKAKSLTGAERRVRQLERNYKRLDELAGRWRKERQLLAMLAADGPCFSNPILVAKAKQMRDEILRVECRLTPEGKPIT